MNFLENCWYCAGWSTDITDKPIHRKLLGKNIVLFRDSKGRVVALGDRCPHRFAPLHEGCVEGDTIQCPYHGLQFDATGSCVLNPHGSGKIPATNKTPAYPVEERDGTLWIWMGDPARANPDDIIDTAFLTDSENFVSRTGCHPVKASYFLVVDNLLDQTHAQFLHPETVFGKAASDRWQVHLADRSEDEENGDNTQEVWYEEDDSSLTSHYLMRGKPTPPLWRPLLDTESCDLYSRTIWRAPANLDLSLDVTPRDEGADTSPAHMTGMHFITPIDELNCYYFYAIGWDVNIHDAQATEEVFKIVEQTVIDEDGAMFEKCQAYMGDNEDLFSLKPILLQTDVMAIKARRRMQKLLDAQREDASPSHRQRSA